MAELGDLERILATVAADVQVGVDKTIRKAALAVDQVLVMSTPVDTGRARANWLTSLDASRTEILAEPSTPEEGPTRALEEATKVVAGYDGTRNLSIHITNNLPYIERLNDGYSKQAPASFVEAAVDAGVKAVNGAKIL